MKLFHNPTSRSTTICYMVEELGIECERRIVRFQKNGDKDSELLKENPLGKVPTLVDGNIRITESAAICLYLADKYDNRNLTPKATDEKRGPFLSWLFWNASSLEYAIIDKSMQRLKPEASATMGYGTFENTIQLLSDHLDSHKYMLGDSFSTLDVSIGMNLHWYCQFGLLEEKGSIARYVKLIRERSAFQKVQTSFTKEMSELEE